MLRKDKDPSHTVVTGGGSKSGAPGMHPPSSVLSSWPPNNPDLSHIWSSVQDRLNNSGCTTFEDFRAAVMEVVWGVPKTMLTRMFDSMPKRLAQMLSKGVSLLNFGFAHSVVQFAHHDQ